MRLYGLTGGIASGKSAVTKILREAGVVVLDMDQIARDVVAPGCDGIGQIADEFGAGYINLDGSLERKKLAALVFAHPVELARLDALMGPLMWAEVQRRQAEMNDDLAFLDAALIVEKGLHEKLDGLVLVVAELPVRVCRAMARDGATEAQVRARMGAQMSDTEKRPHAHFVIDNSGTLKMLRRRVLAVLGEIRG